MTETYDVIVAMPIDGSSAFRATAHDRPGWTSLSIAGMASTPATGQAGRDRLYRDPFFLNGRVDALSQMTQGGEIMPTYDYYLKCFTSVFP